jgi:hypothetical protein
MDDYVKVTIETPDFSVARLQTNDELSDWEQLAWAIFHTVKAARVSVAWPHAALTRALELLLDDDEPCTTPVYGTPEIDQALQELQVVAHAAVDAFEYRDEQIKSQWEAAQHDGAEPNA